MTHFLSPFRYPGGKSWLIPSIAEWLRCLPYRPTLFAEPFAGGSAVGLMAAEQNLADHVTLVELDSDVAAVWRVLLQGDCDQLANRIVSFEFTRENIDEVLTARDNSDVSAAFRTIIRNRINRAGILAPGAGRLNKGEKGKGIASRWYPNTLKKRVLKIAELRDKVTFIEGDGVEFLREHAEDNFAAFFVDPPYTVDGKGAGARLYRHADLNHRGLFRLLSSMKGRFTLTYNDNEVVRSMAEEFGFQTTTIAMRTSHHKRLTELLIRQQAEKC